MYDSSQQFYCFYKFSTMFLFSTVHVLKVKICGYKYTAKYLKNPKASVLVFFPLYMISHWIPKKAHVLLYGLPSVAFSVAWVWVLSPFFFYFRICQISKVSAFMYFILKTITTAVGPEAKKQKKMWSFLNHGGLSGIRWRSTLSGAEQRKLVLGNCSLNF